MNNKYEKVEITNMCLIYKGNKILVQDRTKKDWPGLTFPGGHVKKDENFYDAVIREVKEETGLKIKNPILCGIEEYKNEDCDRNIMLFYKCNEFTGTLKNSKEGKVFWIYKKDLDKYELSLDLKRIYKIMTSTHLSELIYYKKNNKWKSKIV